MRGFISYAHDDHAMLDRFRVHLAALEEAFGLTFWSDESLRAGHHWNDTILDQINQSDVFLLLLSPSFIASPFIRDQERPAIERRRAAVKGLIMPVVLMPCDWERSIGVMQAAPMAARRLLPVSLWDRDDHGFDAARVQLHAAIRDHFGVTDRRNPDTDAVVGYQDPLVTERDDRLDVELEGDAADIAAARHPITRQLHAPNLSKARDLVEMLDRAGNSLDPSWNRFVRAARDLLAALDRPAEEIPAHLGSVWEASVRFASFLLRDKELRVAASRDPEPLPDDIHVAFDDLVGSIAPWVRRFPSARGLDDERGSFLNRPALFEPSARVIHGARDADLLTPHATTLLEGALETADGRDPAQAEKARAFSTQVARGMITRSASYAAGFLAGAVASGYANESLLMKRIGTFMARVETDAVALVADLPADIQHAVTRMVKRAVESGFPGQPGPGGDPMLPPPEARHPKPPEGFMDEVLAMVRRGEAPPEAWRPFITELEIGHDRFVSVNEKPPEFTDLRPLQGLMALRRLVLGRTQIVDLTLLAGLTALRELDLSRTDVSDISVLSSLTALRWLDLTLTHVSDVSVLSDFLALRVLQLSSTRVSDVRALSGLLALQRLELVGTGIRDARPLSGLSSLRWLNLAFCIGLSDVSALSGVSLLQSLDLSRTNVSDVRPLSGLFALRSLYLSDTVVADVSALSGLTALEWLDLSGTNVSDVGALSGLTSLRMLNVTGTTVSNENARALAGLTQLTIRGLPSR